MSETKSRGSSPIAQRPSIEELDYLDTGTALLHNARDTSNNPNRRTIALALLLTIVGFTVQIEAIAYLQDVLGWTRPFLNLYLTHSSLSLPWLLHLTYLRWQQRHLPLRTWLRRYVEDLLQSVTTVEAYAGSHTGRQSALGFLLGTTLLVAAALTVSGLSWFVALGFTTPGDLTAIYNCSAFFAAVFSVPLLKQKIGLKTVVAVALSVAGTFVIAYGDDGAGDAGTFGDHRLLGNLIAAVGAIAFGLYGVIFKRWTDVRGARHSSAGVKLALAASGLTGVYTLGLGWIGVLALAFLQAETSAVPSMQVILWLVVSVISGAVSMTLLLLLVTWTTPVFGSVTSVLSVFFVAIADWLLFGRIPSFATYLGGGLIFVAFGLLAQDAAVAST